MSKVVISKAIERKTGFVYYVDKEGNLRETEISNHKLKRKHKQRKLYKV